MLQPPLEEPQPVAATPLAHSRFRAYTAKRCAVRDKTNGTMCSCLLAGALLYNCCICWRLYHLDAGVELAGRTVGSLRQVATTSVCCQGRHRLLWPTTSDSPSPHPSSSTTAYNSRAVSDVIFFLFCAESCGVLSCGLLTLAFDFS